MKRYFLVELENDSRAKVEGVLNILKVRYNCSFVGELHEPFFEARDGGRIYSDRQLLDIDRQTLSGHIDR